MNVTGPIKTLIAANGTANGLFAGRIYPGVLEQETAYPAAAVNVVGTNPTNSKTTASSLDRVTVQIDVYGETYATTQGAAAAIRGALDYTSSGSLTHIEFSGQQDMFSAKPEIFRVMQTYSIGYK
jgi:hypothetical protein